ncbi:gluzincin family metallopeptidase [Microbacterium alcoholitolerans]|uniref:hypothetical protein n=1 Tax=unclassified Microbacterium TaxID=2609290 RepID=UPI003D18728E
MTESLEQYLSELEALKNIAERMWLDQQSAMPPAAINERVNQAGILQELIQQRLVSDQLGELLDATSGDEPWLGVVREDRAQALRLSSGIWRRFLEVGAQAFNVWEQARKDEDWASFEPWLAKMVEIDKEYAETVGYDVHPMDALLSVYAVGPTHAEISEVLSEMRDFLIDARKAREVEEFEEEGRQPEHLLLAIARDIGELIGFDFARGGIAFSPHGYTSSAGPNDVRITFRSDVPLFEAVSTMVHEYGHALYGQGVAEELWDTPAGHGSMPYLQESQAKFWENIIGRRADFAQRIGEILERRIGRLSAAEWAVRYHRSQTRAASSPIRIATDEISFNLHILLRFEIEEQLLSGTITVADVPQVWNAKSEEYLGIIPATIREGALQDPHWTRRMFGLFTAYVIGNVASAQLAQAMEDQGISIAEAIASRDFSAVLGWLQKNVHSPGRTKSVQEVLQAATGSPLNAAPYRKHLADRYMS